MAYFNPNKLVRGTKEVEAIFEASDFLGLDIIRVIGFKAGAHTTGVSGFDIPRNILNASGLGNTHTLTRGIVYLYPDGNMQKHGFVLATERNKEVLANHLSSNILSILNQKDKAEIVKVAQELGKPTERKGQVPAHVSPTKTMDNNKKIVDAKAKKLIDAEKALEAEKAKTAQLILELENSKRTESIRETSVVANQEALDVAEGKLEVATANAVQDVTNRDVEEKTLGEDGEIETEVKTLPTPKKIVKRKIVKK